MRRHAHAGIGGAEAAIALAFTPALDDLEAEALMEGVGVGVAEGAVGFGVVKQVQRCVSRLFASPDMPLLRAATLFSF